MASDISKVFELLRKWSEEETKKQNAGDVYDGDASQ